MEHLKLNFGDIEQSSILYYDREVDVACVSICQQLKINNMPDYDSENFYVLEGNTFRKKKIGNENRLDKEEKIFDNLLIEKFRNNQHSALFVFKGEVLSGVVHFADYNQTTVLRAIQDDVLTFERKMREYLFLKNFRNEDMIQYFKDRAEQSERSRSYFQSRIRQLERREDEINQLGEFQCFTLKDLLEFANDTQPESIFPYGKIEFQGKSFYESTLVNSLRNLAMHGQNPVEIDEETSVYSIESLEYLFKALKTLETFTYRIEKLIANHIDYRSSVVMENQSKLQIIHKHNPKALRYFIGL